MLNVIGLLVAFSIGICCRLTGVPLPAPPTFIGVILVFLIWLGYYVGGLRL